MRIPTPLLAATALGVVVALVLGLLVAPADAVQGEAQRFMYLHVPAAWAAYLCIVGVVAASAWYLARGGAKVWAFARAASEVGVAMTALTLLTGTVWGALTWGTWWAWDARVMTTAAMGLVYLAHVALTALASPDGSRLARVAAWTGVLGIVTVPLVHFSVVWWRTLHQPPTILAPGTGTPIDATMGIALVAGMISMLLIACCAVVARTRALTPRVVDAMPSSMSQSASSVVTSRGLPVATRRA
ncbi:MAG: cytochrome c biogenesis protein CcsA [Mobilicoccus sp.]|nr:cytochrome c biogenesis protein CcsA [Mobilicoccus sp.]